MAVWTRITLLMLLVAVVVASTPGKDYWKQLEEIFAEVDEDWEPTREAEMCQCSYNCALDVSQGPDKLESEISGFGFGGTWPGCGLHRPPVPGRRWPTPEVPLEISDEFNNTSIKGLHRGV